MKLLSFLHASRTSSGTVGKGVAQALRRCLAFTMALLLLPISQVELLAQQSPYPGQYQQPVYGQQPYYPQPQAYPQQRIRSSNSPTINNSRLIPSSSPITNSSRRIRSSSPILKKQTAALPTAGLWTASAAGAAAECSAIGATGSADRALP